MRYRQLTCDKVGAKHTEIYEQFFENIKDAKDYVTCEYPGIKLNWTKEGNTQTLTMGKKLYTIKPYNIS